MSDALQLPKTFAKPRRAGFYWFRGERFLDWEVVRLDWIDSALFVFDTHDGGSSLQPLSEWQAGEWIECPKPTSVESATKRCVG